MTSEITSEITAVEFEKAMKLLLTKKPTAEDRSGSEATIGHAPNLKIRTN